MDSGYASSNGSGFFRAAEDTNVKECTAAMVLMNLSASPRDKWFDEYHNILSLSNAASSETSSSPITPRPSPATSCSHLPLDEDEVRKNIEERSQINIEQEPYKRTKRCSVIFECTWRGCFQRDSCQEVGTATYCVICGTCNKSFFSKKLTFLSFSRVLNATSDNTLVSRNRVLILCETTKKNSTTQRSSRFSLASLFRFLLEIPFGFSI